MSEEICFIYVMHMPESDLCKIGISKNPNARLRQLSTGSPFKIDPILVLATQNTDWARAIEKSFHHVMRKRRMNGEWFSLSANDAVALMIGNIYCLFKHHIGIEDDDEILNTLFDMGLPELYLEHVQRFNGGVVPPVEASA